MYLECGGRRGRQFSSGIGMAFYAVAVAVGLAALALAAYPLARSRRRPGAAAEFELEFYKSQLREVKRDRDKGLRDADDAAQARIEVSRKILSLDQPARNTAYLAAPRVASLLAGCAFAAAIVPGALLLHARIGDPGMRDMPLAERLAAADAMQSNRPGQDEFVARLGEPELDFVERNPEHLRLLDELRQAVASRPGDVQGLQLLATHEAGAGNLQAAVVAKSKAVEILGDRADAEDHAELAVLMIGAAAGYVSPEAEQALARALERDPEHPAARYYVGAMHAQTGRPDLAFHVWRSLLENAPPSDPWVFELRRQIVEVAPYAGLQYADALAEADPGMPGPDARQLESAAGLTDEERAEMVGGMVDGLEARLADSGGTPEEWARLIRSLGVLGQDLRAERAFDAARSAYSGDSEALEFLDRVYSGMSGSNE